MDQRYGTEVWNGSFKGVWNGGMERVWSRSLFRTSYFDLHPYIYILCDIIYIYIYSVCIYTYIISILYVAMVQKEFSSETWMVPGCYDDLSDFTSSRAHLGRLEPEVRVSFGCQLKILEV